MTFESTSRRMNWLSAVSWERDQSHFVEVKIGNEKMSGIYLSILLQFSSKFCFAFMNNFRLRFSIWDCLRDFGCLNRFVWSRSCGIRRRRQNRTRLNVNLLHFRVNSITILQVSKTPRGLTVAVSFRDSQAINYLLEQSDVRTTNVVAWCIAVIPA